MDAPLALYRRYRPDTFADVIGQAHVTEPLSAALENNRVHHAYLFSGPRGCGKTTSARILARALNCDKGPTSTPCGSCESCVELARGGPGSIDVIEIDAASHGGVDDARELREGAFFTPMKARYKVYIIDEAHMVTPQGFNALLKLVEEPPAHVRFVFATTEPDKVIGTIRSRTHHYPFRLVPPKVLGDYLVDLCSLEGVAIQPTVVPLVARAGAGSVRDSLSVLDQLIGGSGPDGVTYALTTALLGYTPETLIDETIDALAADDGASLFAVIDKVIDTGQDPRRFAEDLLHRLRDLVIVSAVPDAASGGLLEVTVDQAERLTGQAARFGRAELTRAADIVSVGLTEMRGATAPRLLLELMCARILLPGADASAEGLGARLARLERRLSVVTDSAGGQQQGSRPVSSPQRQPRPVSSEPDAPTAAAALTRQSVLAAGAPELLAPAPSDATDPATHPSGAPLGTPARQSGDGQQGSGSPMLTLLDVRQLWPGVLERVKALRRFSWMLLKNAQVKDVAGGVLTIGLVNAGARDSFLRSGADEILRQAVIDELGVDWRVQAIIDGPGVATRTFTSTRQEPSTSITSPAGVQSGWRPASERDHGGETPPTTNGAPTGRSAADKSEQGSAAKGAIRTTRTGAGTSRPTTHTAEHEVSDDDEVLDDPALSSQELLTRELGAQLIDDIRHDSA